ncbi:MAG: chromosome segregation protein SMC [Liquorilactobacillus ghanensis]|uniref:chromosome segregation protein SMC n=1 Tax=Liquorilactobacillus ghanensis TaxID=399370 RepID=UPI0039E80B2B
MKLKSLVLDGFKSFAQKTQIEFRPGLTAIVGPNGSGKSNLVEAIRWVLGEQSAKSLRGSRMPDVIFAGSNDQAALNRAEVEITFDNSDHFLAVDTDEVAITRRLFRDGTSEFLLNQKFVRLKDITDLLMDTGLGKDSFSLISQGKVEQVFNSKPEERRQFIEEAAGILKYKKERLDAQSKMAETDDHLLRVADIVSELAGQVEPLKQQASAAKDYLNQKKQLTYFERSQLIYRLKTTAKQQTNQQAKLKAATVQATQQQQLATDLQQQQKKLQQEQQQVVQRLDNCQSELVKIVQQREQLNGQQRLTLQQQDYREQRQQTLNQQLATAEQEQQQLQTQLHQLEQRLAQQQQKITSVKTAIKTKKKELQLDSAELQTQIEELRNQIVAKMQRQASVNNQINYLTKEHQRQLLHQQQLTARLTQLQQQQDTTATQHNDAANTVAELKKKLQQQQQQQQQLINHQKELQQRYTEQQQRWYQANGIFQQTRAKYDSFHEISSNYSNYYQGVKQVLLAKKQLTGIIGSVAELLSVPSKIAVAIETVLGGQLQNIVVTDELAAKQAISYLKTHHFGRVTFLPRTTIQPRKLPLSIEQRLKNLSGIIGIASQLVKTADSNQMVLEHLLATTVIVDSIDNAIIAARKLNFRYRIVSLDGDVINAGGSMSGGFRRSNNGLLSQQQQTTELAAAVDKMKKQLAKIEELGGQLKQQQQAVAQQLMLLEPQVKQATQAYQTAATNLKLQQNETGHLQQQLTAQQFEVQQSNLSLNNFAADQAKAVQEKQQLATDLAKLKQEFASRQRQLENITAVHHQQEIELAELQQKQAVLLQQQASSQQRVNELKKRITQQALHLEQYRSELTELTANADQQQLSGESLQQRLAQLQQQQQIAEQKLQKLQQQRAQLQQQAAQLQSKSNRQAEIQQLAQQELQQLKYQTEQQEQQLDHDLQTLSEKYQLTFEAAQQLKIETDPVVIERQLKLLRRSISELGEVNLGAIKEFERVNQRYQFLTAQRQDLLEAKAELQKSMLEIDQEVKSRFQKTFKQIAAAFSQIFPEMFGGGQASLKLTEPNDLLQTGIEIMAQPPGKKLQRLSLLSGGEKALTAIVLLFAILQIKPVPFVILDETEAALDDANVDRYAQYLQKFCKKAQFIVITHRKGTMDHANVLYGVTMQQSGISKMVSVALT